MSTDTRTNDRAPGAGSDESAQAPIAQTGFGTARVRFSRRTALALVVALLALIAGVVLVGDPGGDEYAPLDPRSPAPDGLAGVLELLGNENVHVDITTDIPSDTSAKIFVPMDPQRQEEREAVRDFAERGGTVIVAGATALTHELEPAGAPMSDFFGSSRHLANCTMLESVGEIHHGNWDAMEVPADAESCFEMGDGAWLVARPTGGGTIIALGSAAPFTNDWLADDDNAVLAAALLGPAPGDSVVVRPLPQVGEGDTPILELVPAGFWRGLILLGLALLALVLWKGRRLGAPVAEKLPPVLPSAELARSVGQLYQRVGDREGAAKRLRDDCRRTVSRGLNFAVETPPQVLIDQLVHRTAVRREDALLALTESPVLNDDALHQIAGAVARVRHDYQVPPDGGVSTNRTLDTM